MLRDKKAMLDLTKTNFNSFSWKSLVFLALAITVLIVTLGFFQ
ncbi:MAG: hypothetical protein WBD03_06210 [Thermoplasmata archaeon]